MISAGSPAC
ncbi:hypothetical protein YPPY36_4546, partial [Yersinia pestis PY-36]